MASEIRVDKINSLSGVGTVTLSPTGVDIAGITTAATLRATTGIVTSLTAGSLTSLGAVSGTTGTFTGDVDIADKIVHTGDTNTAIRFPAADTVTAETGGSERVRIDSSGRVIIGHNASVAGDGSSEFSFQILGTTYVTSGLSQQRYANDVSGPSIILSKSRATSVGTHTIVQDDDQLGKIRFYGSDGNDFDNYGAEIAGHVDGSPGSNDMPGRLVFKTTADGAASPTERLRIDSLGRVMIGSGTYIGGAALAVLGTSSTPNAYGSLAIGKVGANPTSGTTLANIRLNGGSVGTGRGAEINAIADANWSDGSSHPTYLTFSTVASSSTSATERIRVHAGGNVDIKTGNLVISTSGKGIDFSATGGPTNGSGTSELFDDYEEGTFTPNWDAGGGVTFTYYHQYGFYTKIGDTVTFTLYLQAYASTITGGNENNGVALQGLPFTIKNHSRYYPAFTIGRTYKFDINSDQRIYSYGEPNSTNSRFIMETDDSTGNVMVADQLNQNTCEIFLSGTYKI